MQMGENTAPFHTRECTCTVCAPRMTHLLIVILRMPCRNRCTPVAAPAAPPTRRGWERLVENAPTASFIIRRCFSTNTRLFRTATRSCEAVRSRASKPFLPMRAPPGLPNVNGMSYSIRRPPPSTAPTPRGGETSKLLRDIAPGNVADSRFPFPPAATFVGGAAPSARNASCPATHRGLLLEEERQMPSTRFFRGFFSGSVESTISRRRG